MPSWLRLERRVESIKFSPWILIFVPTECTTAVPSRYYLKMLLDQPVLNAGTLLRDAVPTIMALLRRRYVVGLISPADLHQRRQERRGEVHPS